MNIIKRCKQLVTAEFDNAVKGELDPDWREAFQRLQKSEVIPKSSTAKISGREAVHVPALSIDTVYAKGSKPTKDEADICYWSQH